MQEAVSIIHNRKVMRGMQHLPEGDNLPAVILFHGFTGTKLEPHQLFLKISRALEAKGVASFRFDFLGSGESDGEFKDMTVSGELDEARTIFNYVKSHPAIDPGQITVLGFSMGGLLASLLAGELQDAIDKLILLAPAATIARSARKIEENAPYIASHDAYDNGGNLVGKKFIDEVKALEVWDLASKYAKEVLLIHGTDDKAVPVEASLMYVEKCYQDKAVLHTIDGADHTFNRFQWEMEVIEDVSKFMLN
ncbi:alpha/beta hydrolase [Bacillus sp. T33-2]|uniref:alpha/beta hydrolase n=1 Tax=Bacillus sp. T33-2 TaxID=2054168 RepID=UPI000C785AFB|nr:alpha/beta fold hydrolase [Bacillus sp. T33-2]PLR96808.1 alpha/beta hydrolase [Bacillus sp. T33-2]